MSLTKATIEVLHRPGEPIEVQFNPNTLSLKKDVVVSEIGVPGLNSPLLQYVRGEAEILDLELFCDTTRDGMDEDARDVREFTDPIRRLAEVDPDIHSIPVIRFTWGKGLAFTAVLVRVEQSFTLFNPGGVPLRAHLRVRLKEFRTLKEQLGDLKIDDRGGRLADDQRRDAAGPEAKYPRIEPTLSRIGLHLGGKPLGDEVARDLLGFAFSDSVDGDGRFELTLNDQGEGRAAFKYADTLLFRPGTTVEIFLSEAAGSPARSVVGGSIHTVRHTTEDDNSVVVVAGVSEAIKKARGLRKKALRLDYGRSLISFEPTLTLGRSAGSSARSSDRSRQNIQVAGNGVAIGLPGLRAGSQVELAGLGKSFSGGYVVQATTHTLDSRGYTTRFECLGRRGE